MCKALTEDNLTEMRKNETPQIDCLSYPSDPAFTFPNHKTERNHADIKTNNEMAQLALISPSTTPPSTPPLTPHGSTSFLFPYLSVNYLTPYLAALPLAPLLTRLATGRLMWWLGIQLSS